MIMIIMALMIIATYTTYDYNDNYYYNYNREPLGEPAFRRRTGRRQRRGLVIVLNTFYSYVILKRQPPAGDQPGPADHRGGDLVSGQPDGSAHPPDRAEQTGEVGLLRPHLPIQPHHLGPGIPSLQVPYAYHAGRYH